MCWEGFPRDTIFILESSERCCLITKSCLTLCDPKDYSLPGSSVHEISQARILEWVAISFSRGIFPTQGWNPGLLHCRQTLYRLSHQGSPRLWKHRLCLRRLAFCLEILEPWTRTSASMSLMESQPKASSQSCAFASTCSLAPLVPVPAVTT